MRLQLLVLSLALSTSALADHVPIDQVPMYGGMDRAAVPELKAADEKLIADTMQHYGSRAKASAAFVDAGMNYYYHDDLAAAMRRFNQAWLLDPDNPEAYWGFAAVAADRGKNCDSSKWFDKALSFGRYVPGMNPDAARLLVLCARDDKGLGDDAKAEVYKRGRAL
jgi:hypothetical protein